MISQIQFFSNPLYRCLFTVLAGKRDKLCEKVLAADREVVERIISGSASFEEVKEFVKKVTRGLGDDVVEKVAKLYEARLSIRGDDSVRDVVVKVFLALGLNVSEEGIRVIEEFVEAAKALRVEYDEETKRPVIWIDEEELGRINVREEVKNVIRMVPMVSMVGV